MKDDPACIKRAEDHYKKYLKSRRARGGRNPRDKSDATADTSKCQFTEYKDIVGVYTVMVCRWTDHILARNPLLEVEADLS